MNQMEQTVPNRCISNGEAPLANLAHNLHLHKPMMWFTRVLYRLGCLRAALEPPRQTAEIVRPEATLSDDNRKSEYPIQPVHEDDFSEENSDWKTQPTVTLVPDPAKCKPLSTVNFAFDATRFWRPARFGTKRQLIN